MNITGIQGNNQNQIPEESKEDVQSVLSQLVKLTDELSTKFDEVLPIINAKTKELEPEIIEIQTRIDKYSEDKQKELNTKSDLKPELTINEFNETEDYIKIAYKPIEISTTIYNKTEIIKYVVDIDNMGSRLKKNITISSN